jgi:hypothetical protein
MAVADKYAEEQLPTMLLSVEGVNISPPMQHGSICMSVELGIREAWDHAAACTWIPEATTGQSAAQNMTQVGHASRAELFTVSVTPGLEGLIQGCSVCKRLHQHLPCVNVLCIQQSGGSVPMFKLVQQGRKYLYFSERE